MHSGKNAKRRDCQKRNWRHGWVRGKCNLIFEKDLISPGELFRLDARNLRHQRHCPKPACRMPPGGEQGGCRLTPAGIQGAM